uniref:DnaK suppressor protein n=1 Tax=mine drainage metagenome TaxID=410659 RepID=E6PNA4_9ZZZZ
MVKAAKPETSRAKSAASKTTPARGAKTVVKAVVAKRPVAPAAKAPAPKRTAGATSPAGLKARKTTTASPAKPLAKAKAAIPVASKASAHAPPAVTKSDPSTKTRASAAAPKTPTPVRATLPPAQAQKPAPAVANRPQVAAPISASSAAKSMSSLAPTQTPAKADPKLANAWKIKAPKDLTDAEVLAMPESEYMKAVQLEFFKHRLSTLRNDILRSAGETTEHLREDTLLVPDPADRATIEEEHALELRARDRERKLLKKVEQVLLLIDAGEYGWCEETGEPIGIGRLLARPTATLSLEAQQRREMKQKMFGD